MIPIIEQAKQHPDRIAILSDHSSFTFDDFLSGSRLLASQILADQGDLEEARIAFMVEPSFEYTAIQWGIWQAGGIVVPLCNLHPPDALRYTLSDTKSGKVIGSLKFSEKLQPICDELNMEYMEYGTLNSNGPQKLPDIAPERRAMILYTSGTTSKPKGVITTHANITAQIKTLVNAWSWSENDHVLNILPLHHVHGIINVKSCALWSGATCEFMPKFDAGQVIRKFMEGRVNVFMAVPTIYFKLIKALKELNKSQRIAFYKACQNFRLMVSGSAALPVPVLEKWEELTGHRLLERYGMTELGMALSNPYIGERRPGYVGKPLPGVGIRLVGVVVVNSLNERM